MKEALISLLIGLYIASSSASGIAMFNSASVISLSTYKSYEKSINDAENAKLQAEEQAKADALKADEELHTYTDLQRKELTGYCIVEVPTSHFTLVDSKSSSTKAEYTYRDNLSYIDISFNTSIKDGDTEQLAKIVSNYSEEPEHKTIDCDGIEAIQVEDATNTDGFSRVSWYVLKGNSVFIVDAYIAPEVEREAFYGAVSKLISTLNTYYISGTVFKTPTSGYYENNTVTEPTETTESNSSENTSENSTNQEQTDEPEMVGVIKTTEVSNNWKDLTFKLDGDMLGMFETVSEYLKLGYKIKDIDVIGDKVRGGYESTLILYKDDGVTIRVGAKNPTDSTLKVEALTVTKLEVNIEDFGAYIDNPRYTSEDLPELVFMGGITWDILAENIPVVLPKQGENFNKLELSNGDYKSTYETSDHTLELDIITKNYKNIKSIKILYKK